MEPNFSNGDYLLIDEATYRFREPERGEVIVFKNPSNTSQFYIKRIIGLPGEEVVVNDTDVRVDGESIDEIYLEDFDFEGQYIFELDDDEYFVMGDNRSQSFDSRNWGPLGDNLVVGLVRLRFWPPAAFGPFAY